MVNRNAALAHHLLEIAIAHPVAAIPPDRPERDLTLEVAPLEVRHAQFPPSRRPHPDGQRRSLQQSPSNLAAAKNGPAPRGHFIAFSLKLSPRGRQVDCEGEGFLDELVELLQIE